VSFLLYFFISLILIAVILFYFQIATHFDITDKPNVRSSHRNITIRGGGIIFPVAALIWFFLYGFAFKWTIAGLSLIAIISFMDDLKPLSGKVRIIVHFVAISLMFYDIGIYNLSWYWLLLVYLLTIYWINAFNFMDGINAITPFYSLSALLFFEILNIKLKFFPKELIIILMLSVLIFSYFNARKRAKAFAGDVGSVSMAFLLVWMLISLILKTGNIEYILFFSIYILDTLFTLFFRILRRENIFQAHRLHLYQLLSNELKRPHIQVSLLYAISQTIVNLIVVLLIRYELMNFIVFLFILTVLSIVYLAVYRVVTIKIKNI
jgi:UDP-N-acetylmuramyl pentapeptide phosphotransferase/UDP-N-acetylglucosamine-1-phosphate transferase